MRKLYEQLAERIQKVDFNQIFRGFHPYEFAIYNTKNIFLKDKIIDYDNRFIGNTSIEFEDKNLAIWNMQYKVKDLDVFASLLIHEMFHCHQRSLNECRFADEFQGMFYQLDQENMQLKKNEMKSLLEAYEQRDIQKLLNFVVIRKKREMNYLKEVDFDNKTETIEGTAHYVELNALKQLNEKAFNSGVREVIDFISDEKNLFKFRHLSYMTGTLIWMICDTLEIDIKHDISNESSTIFDLLSRKLGYTKNIPIPKLISFNLDSVSIEVERRKKEISELNQMEGERYLSNKIIGYDPMNSYGFGDYLVFKNFLMFMENKEKHTIFGNGIACIKDKDNIIIKFV